jgi:hypothetical protein
MNRMPAGQGASSSNGSGWFFCFTAGCQRSAQRSLALASPTPVQSHPRGARVRMKKTRPRNQLPPPAGSQKVTLSPRPQQLAVHLHLARLEVAQELLDELEVFESGVSTDRADGEVGVVDRFAQGLRVAATDGRGQEVVQCLGGRPRAPRAAQERERPSSPRRAESPDHRPLPRQPGDGRARDCPRSRGGTLASRGIVARAARQPRSTPVRAAPRFADLSNAAIDPRFHLNLLLCARSFAIT